MSNQSSSDELFITRKIYAIRCNLDNIIYYIGSTKNSLQRRMNRHLVGYKRYTIKDDKRM